MKQNNFLLLLLFLFLPFNIFSQTLNATLTLNPYPSPYVSDWEINPSALGSLTIIKSEGPGFPIIIRAIVSMQGRGEVFRTTTKQIQLSDAIVQVLNNTTIIGISDANFSDKDYESKIKTTGRLLEGYYSACLTIENLSGVILASNVCSNFTILYPSAQQLILPINNDSLEYNNNYPVFQWTPVIVPPTYQIKYKIRIAEILQGQTPAQAINANIPHYENNQILSNNFVYPIDALPLEQGKKYAWQIQAIDQYGYPPTQNQGKSEIFIFTKKKQSRFIYQIPISLKEPDNNSVVKTKSPKFSWEFTPPQGVLTKYVIRIVEVQQNQNLETAIKNYPLVNQTTMIKSYQPSQPIGLNPGRTYSWRVIALNSQTNDTIRKSDIRTFTVHPLLLLLPNDNSAVNMKCPTFQWAFYGGSKKFYDIKVIKLPMFYYNPQGIIEESLFDDPQNIVYQKSNIDGEVLTSVHDPLLEIPVFKPDADISMEEGKSYYWQVSVRNQKFGSIITKSEIRKITFNPYMSGFATNCNVTGKLYYEFAKQGEYTTWPLKNTNVKFVVKYILKYSSHSGSNYYQNYLSPQGEFEVPITALPTEYHNDYNKTIAIVKTDNDGNFSFSFMNLKPMGVIDNNFIFSGGGGEFKYSYSGKLYRVVRLIVESPYYTSPEKDIIIQPGETQNYGQMIAYVRSYSLTVTVKSPGTYLNNQYLPANSPIPKMFVYILRKNRPNDVPSNEGLPTPTNMNESPFYNSYQSGYRVIAKTTTDVNGKATFDRLVKSVYSQNDEYMIFALPDSNQTSLSYRTLISIKFDFKNPNDKAVYNFEYNYPTTTKEIVAFPIEPVVKGKIKRQDGGQPVAGAQVRLVNWALFWWQQEASQNTNSNGIFRFSNLKNVFDENGNVTGPVRGLKITKYGFKDTSVAVKNGSILKPGESWSTEILLQPESKVIGEIVDENGSGVSAVVTVLGGESVNAIAPMVFILPDLKRPSAKFELRAPKGNIKIIVDPIPYDNSFMKDTIDVFVSSNEHNLGKIILKKSMHRIKIFAGDESKYQGEFGYITAKLQGANVKLETSDGVLIGEKTTDQTGFVEFIFANPKSQYKITVTGPPNLDFEKRQVNIYNKETKSWKNYYVLLKPAAKVSGYVYVGTQNQPVANARVTIKGTDNGTFPVAYTDNNGYYVLRNVPLGILKFIASKKSSNLVGDETFWVVVKSEGVENVNFNLKVYSDMDITHLLGFPIEVDALKEQGGEIKISGRFVDLETLNNNLFSSKQSTLQFTDVSIVPDANLTSVIFGVTVPISKPKILPLKTDANNLSLAIFTQYFGNLSDNKIGIELISGQNNTGTIKGKVKISDGSFNISSQNLKFNEDGFFITQPNSNDLNLSVITADKSLPYNTDKFPVVSSNGKEIPFKLFGFNSDAATNNSFIYKDSLVLNTTIHTNIEGVNPSDLNLSIGNVNIGKNNIKPITSTKKINLALDNWNLEIDKWTMSGVLAATGGTLKTNLVDIPLKGLQLKPNELSNLSFNFNSMNLGGIAPLKIVGNTMFGYENQGIKKWYLTISKGNQNYAASFGGLPGMEKNDSIRLNSFSLYSDGSKNFSPQYKTLKIYKVGKLNLNQMIVGNNSIEMGSLDFNIPKLGQLGALIQYYKDNNVVKLKLIPVPIKITTNAVELAFGTNSNNEPMYFDENGLRVRGTVTESGKFSFISWLYHTKDSTSIWVETPNSPLTMSNKWQQQEVGGPKTYLDKVVGCMEVKNNSWQNFWFSGYLITPSGIEPNKNQLKFIVYGDIVASNQELGIKNISSPFGNISFTYEPENKRFVGSLAVDKDLGYAYIKGQAEAVVDDEGWYFFTGGSLQVYNPESKGAAAILIGHHSITDAMVNTFKQFSYVYKHKGSLPLIFPTSLSGFYMEGMTSIPVQSILGIPNIDIDLVVVSAKLWVNIGADMRLSMQFSDNLTIGAGMDNFIEAGFSVSEWFVVECAKLSFGAVLDIGSEGYVSSNGDWASELTGDLTLSGKAKVGWGVCDSDCEGKLCDEDSWTGSKTFGIKGHIGSDGKYIDFYSK